MNQRLNQLPVANNLFRGFPSGSDGRVRLQCRRPSFNPWVGEIPWRRAWQSTLVFLPGEPHGQRSYGQQQMGYSPWGHIESNTTEGLTHTHSSFVNHAYVMQSPQNPRKMGLKSFRVGDCVEAHPETMGSASFPHTLPYKSLHQAVPETYPLQ